MDDDHTCSEHQLTIEYSAICPVEGCNKKFKSSSCSLMHQLRRHEKRSLPKSTKEGKTVYFCPEETCQRSEKSGGRPFPRLGQLKQHYQTVHASKKYQCDKCGRKFGLRDVFKRHLGECGLTFTCQSCGDDFHSKNALYQHCKRKGHTSSFLLRQTTAKETVLRPVIVAPVIIVPIPVSQLAESSHASGTQQEQQWIQCLSSSRPMASVQTKEATASSTSTSPDVLVSSSDGLLNTDCLSTSFDLAIQTDSVHDYSAEGGNVHHEALSSPINQGVQTMSVASNELGTQTVGALDCNYFSSSVICDEHSLADAHLHLSGAESDMKLSLLPPECNELGTQTMKSAFDDISCLDFGVQTLLPTETRDQGSQTHSNTRTYIMQ